jgi:hypothetical protein
MGRAVMYQNDTNLCSVTEAFSPYISFDFVSPTILAAACDRGCRVHDAVAQDLSGEFFALDCDITGYFAAYQKFRKNIEAVELVEKRMQSDLYQYTGQVDLVCRMRGDAGLTLVDWKTSVAASKSWSLQVSAYAHLAEQEGMKIERAMAVQLGKDGVFRVNEYRDLKKNFNRFLSALSTFLYFNPKKQLIQWEGL